MQLVVADIEAAHAQLSERGVEVSDVQDFPWGRFVFFSDPDGNGWAVQQIPSRGMTRRWQNPAHEDLRLADAFRTPTTSSVATATSC